MGLRLPRQRHGPLDLVVFAAPAQRPRVAGLKEALDESRLPFLVDVHVGDEVLGPFRKTILERHVVLVGENKVGVECADESNAPSAR